MKSIINTLLSIVILAISISVSIGGVNAVFCDSGSPCDGGWYCVNGSCVSDSGCWENVCQAPDTCQGDICIPAGGSSDCPCGLNTAQTGCRSCPSENVCYANVSCPPNMVDPNSYYDSVQWKRNSCPIGNAQSWYQNCWDDAGQTVCEWVLRTHACCPDNSSVQCTTTYGSNYTVYDVNCFQSSNACGNNDLVSIQYGAGTSQCYREWNEEDQSWGNRIYNDNVICRTKTVSCSCVSNCTSTAPTAPTLTAPANGSQQASTSVSLMWSAPSSWGTGCPSTTRTYNVYVGTTNPPTTAILSNVSSTTTSTNFSGVRGQTYYWYVRASNGSATTPSVVRSFTISQNTITGTVYLDSNNNCSTATPWTTGGVSVSVDGGGATSIAANGTYTVTANPGGGHSVAIGLPSGYICSTGPTCSAGCPTKTSITSPSVGNNFYLTNRREAWWQAVGGSIYSAGNVRSEMPLASTSLIAPASNGAYGALMRDVGTLDTGAGRVSTTGYTAQTKYRGKIMNYDYFAAHMGVTGNTANDWVVNTLSKPVNNPNKTFYYMRPTASEASITTPWTVANGESYVVFVNGDLRIASNITVAPGGFLAFIVNGTVRVSPAITSIQGLYVIDGTLITESNGGTDVAANFEGSVVTWGGVNLGRDLVGGNLAGPAEKFTYRPDLLTNMPEAMKVFALRWEEVVPGTIGQ